MLIVDVGQIQLLLTAGTTRRNFKQFIPSRKQHSQMISESELCYLCYLVCEKYRLKQAVLHIWLNKSSLIQTVYTYTIQSKIQSGGFIFSSVFMTLHGVQKPLRMTESGVCLEHSTVH